MSPSQPTDLTLDKALTLLKSYDCVKVTNTNPLVELEKIRSSLLLITSLSTSQNIGVCADNFQQGFAALTSYLEALGYQSNLERENMAHSSEPIYLKFSTQKMSYYSSKYTEHYRGVLIACQSEDDAISGVYGHFPLDLFNISLESNS